MMIISQRLYYLLLCFPACFCAALFQSMIFQPTMVCNNDICWGPAPIQWSSLIVDMVFFYLCWLVIFCVAQMVMRKIIKMSSRKTKINMVLFALAVFSTLATVYAKVDFFSQAELDNISCGWPMRYLSSPDIDGGPSPEWFPWTTGCIDALSNEWGSPLDMQWTFFIINIIFFYLLWLMIYYGGRKIMRKMRQQDKLLAKNNNT